MLVTDKHAFRGHLASFALDRLWRLYVETWRIAVPMLDRAGISSDESLDADTMTSVGAKPVSSCR
ncbi:hypothetical protein WSS_A41275 [Rhodococcus opacus M213]|uniref:Uncharacterized protein n=1 Tax=Rhodococcus opacus M213 TaxID=1129896 RepID=K8XHX1_RHOOP|nr:hypothetical protein WSS_A41275 [Rhodococcus opacus M213]